jgi:hypothetical protein
MEPRWEMGAQRASSARATVLMTAEEARACCDKITMHLVVARNLIMDLYAREGWRALGYASWRECVTTEFGRHQSTLYRQLQAAQVEQNLFATCETETIPDSVLRALAPLSPEAQRDLAAIIDLHHINAGQALEAVRNYQMRQGTAPLISRPLTTEEAAQRQAKIEEELRIQREAMGPMLDMPAAPNLDLSEFRGPLNIIDRDAPPGPPPPTPMDLQLAALHRLIAAKKLLEEELEREPAIGGLDVEGQIYAIRSCISNIIAHASQIANRYNAAWEESQKPRLLRRVEPEADEAGGEAS